MSDSINGNGRRAEDTIKVVARFRPLNELEEKSGTKFIASFPQDNIVNFGNKVYQFDNILKPNVSQEKVYETSAKDIVKDVLNGHNGTIFAYGQTSSGKTHTMEGVMADPHLCGIIPRIIHDIFNHIYTMEEHLEFQLKVSYFEIYMDKIKDLLDVSRDKIMIKSDKKGVPFLIGLSEKTILDPKSCHSILMQGKANRHISKTMNSLI